VVPPVASVFGGNARSPTLFLAADTALFEGEDDEEFGIANLTGLVVEYYRLLYASICLVNQKQ
jgi:hypothetical protein